MRGWLIGAAVMITVGFAYWAYKINYRTDAALDTLDRLEYRIAQEKARIAILEGEWAYLNRPDRLRNLVELNFDKLQLMQIATGNYGTFDDIPLAPPEIPEINLDGIDPTDLDLDYLDVEPL